MIVQRALYYTVVWLVWCDVQVCELTWTITCSWTCARLWFFQVSTMRLVTRPIKRSLRRRLKPLQLPLAASKYLVHLFIVCLIVKEPLQHHVTALWLLLPDTVGHMPVEQQQCLNTVPVEGVLTPWLFFLHYVTALWQNHSYSFFSAV